MDQTGTMQGNVVRESGDVSHVGGQTSRNLMGRPAYEQCASFADALERSNRMREACEEIEIPAEKVCFGIGEGGILNVQLDGLTLAPTHYFLQQVASQTNVGLALMEKLTVPTLTQALRETWDLTGPRRFLIAGGQKVRCFVGDRYERLWDHQILESIDRWLLPDGRFVPAVPTVNRSFARRNADGTMKPALFVGDRSSHFFFYSDKRDDRNGGMRAGLTVNNSEVGFRKFDFRTFTFMEMCANFLIWSPAKVREWMFRHTKGGIQEGFRAFEALERELTDNLLPLTLEALDAAKVAPYVEVVTRVDREAEKRAVRNNEDPLLVTRKEIAVRKLVRSTSLTTGQARRGVDAAFLPENNLGADPFSIFGIVQGVTDAAKDEDYQDAMVSMIEQGSGLLDLVSV